MREPVSLEKAIVKPTNMKTQELLRSTYTLAMAAFASAWMAITPEVRANDWNNVGVGWWNDAANWIGGLPDNTQFHN